jgi:effector-binding domain-containing protein
MIKPEKKRIEAQTVIAMGHSGSYDEIGGVYRRLHDWARKRDVKVKGNGFTVFLSPPSEFDPHSAHFEVCLPTDSAPKPEGGVTVRQLPACTVAAVVVKGPYSTIPGHYTEMLAWLAAEGLEVAGPPREAYIKRPDARGHGKPEEFVTEIQFPV